MTHHGIGDTHRGSVTVFFAVAAIGLFAMVGLVVDGGAKVKAIQRADRVAAEAARAAGQAIDVPTAIVGDVPVVRPGDAVAAAEAYLRASGLQGTVTVLDGGRRVQVRTTAAERTIFLGLIGIQRLTGTGEAEVTLVRGVTGAGQ
jgi:hypothetical protein